MSIDLEIKLYFSIKKVNLYIHKHNESLIVKNDDVW